jgi:hypothetical protein
MAVDAPAVTISFVSKNTNDHITGKEIALKSLPGILLPLGYLHRVCPPIFHDLREYRVEVLHQPRALQGRLEGEVIQVYRDRWPGTLVWYAPTGSRERRFTIIRLRNHTVCGHGVGSTVDVLQRERDWHA